MNRTGRFALAVGLLALLATACGGKDGKDKAPPRKKKPVMAAPVTAEPAAEPVAAEPPLELPAGQTVGDLLPALPTPVPRLAHGGGDKPAAVYPNVGCVDLGPEGFGLVRRLEITLPAGTPGGLPGVLEACLFQKALERKDRVGRTGKIFHLVAAWPGDVVQALEIEEFARPPQNLPPDLQKSGHDASAWGALIATGWPEAPVMAVLSARFYDGILGDEVTWRRDARWLQAAKGGAKWAAFEKRDFATVDLEQLRLLCEGPAEEKGTAPLQAACDRFERLAGDQERQAADRQALRAKRLKGQGDDKVTPDAADPQAIWLRDARRALKANAWREAIELALRADAVCAEPTTEAHAVLKEALEAGHQAPARVQPAQATVDLCEPLPDKPSPKRKLEAPKLEAPKSGDKGERAP